MTEEIKEEKLDSPLVVHHKSDASYQETAGEIELFETHDDNVDSTLTRHRFRKNKEKKGNKKIFALFLVVIIFALLSALCLTGNLQFGNQVKTNTTSPKVSESTTVDLITKYKGTIVIKGTYIFVDGIEVNGIEGLQKALKYVDPEKETYRIIDDSADGNFKDFDVLPILSEMGFYNEKTTIEHSGIPTGLMAAEELTEHTTKESTKSKKNKKSKNKSKNNPTNENIEE